jgi:hypothetical protein
MIKRKKTYPILLVLALGVAFIAMAISAVQLDGKKELRDKITAEILAKRASLSTSAAQPVEQQQAMKSATQSNQDLRASVSASVPTSEENQAALDAKAAEQAAIEAKLEAEMARGADKSAGPDYQERWGTSLGSTVPYKKPYEGPQNEPRPDPQKQGGDDIASAVVITSLPYSNTGTTSGYNDDYDEECPYSGSTSPDVVYAFTPTADVLVDISLCNAGTDYDTKLYLYEDTYTPGSPYACNDDACPGYVSEILGLTLYAGHTYYIVIDGYGGAFGNYEITINEVTPCVVECPPGAFQEPETCGDDTNGGCNMAVPQFTPIDCGDTVCGTVWADNGTRDTDWYELVLTQTAWVTWSGTAEFPFVLGFVDTSDCNLASQLDPYALGDPCDTITVTKLCQPGTYWLFASHQDYYDNPCGTNNNYWAAVSCEFITEGACCYDDGSCVPGMDEAACYASGGTSWMGGMSCTPNPCPTAGDNCEDPIKVELPTRVPWSDLNQTTCGRGNDYDQTCLGYYDGGEDIIYEITVLSPIEVDITLDPKGTSWTGFAVSTDCPPNNCIAQSTSSSGDPHGVTCLSLEPGVYYIMVDTWPSPDCIPDFDLLITAAQDCQQIENDDCANATPIGEVTDLAFTTDGATFDGPGGCQTAPNIWYCYTAGETGTATISLCGSSYDTKLAVYDGCDCWGPMLDCNDDAPCGKGERSLQSEIQIPVVAGNQYLIEIGGYGTNVGDGILNISVAPPCIVECPPGAFAEPETCGDDTNGGCNMPTPQFTPINCGDTVCGTVWADGGTRDTDWYELVLTQATLVTWSAVAEFDVVIGFVDTSDCNLASQLDPYATGSPCDTISVSKLCQPGTYWLFVSHQDYYNNPCGVNNNYWAAVTCEPVTEGACCYDDGSCVPGMDEAACFASGGTSWLGGEDCTPNLCPQPPYECPPGSILEGEDCGADINGGCNSSPPVFGEINCGDTLCGEAWADAGWRDTDWYTLVITENTYLTISGKGGFPLQVLLIGYTGDCNNYDIINYFQVDANVEGTIDALVTPGTYWVWAGTIDYEGYSCATGPWYYHVAVSCEPAGAIYCPTSSGCSWEYICNVAVGDINNASGCDGYGDYTALSTTMEVGVDYAITVDNCNSWSSDVCGVWVDWNQDMDFNDANEFLQLTGGPDQFTGTITPPSDALPGPTRMRVRVVDETVDPLDPCVAATYGDVEDYTIEVAGGVTYLFEPDTVYVLYKYSVDTMSGAIYLSSDAVGGDVNNVTDVSLQVGGCTVPISATEVIPGGYGDLVGDVLKVSFNIADYITCEEADGLVYDQIDSFFDVFYQLNGSPGSFSGSVPMIGHTSGDLNLDGQVNIADLTLLVNYLFRNGDAPEKMELADVDGSGGAPNVADLTYFVDYLFRGGPVPQHP